MVDTVTHDDPPVEIRRRGSRRSRVIFALAVLALLIVLPLSRPLVGGTFNYVMQIATIALMWVALSTSWNLIGGYAGYISLGNNVFFGIGGYLAGALLVYQGWSPFLTAPLAGLLGMAVGVVVGLITLRTRGPAFIIATIALLLMAALVFDNWELVGGANGLSLPLPDFPREWVRVPFYAAMAVIAIGSTLLSWKVAHSKLGLGLRALAQDETKAEVLGINTRRYKVIAYSLSAIFPAMAGAVWGYSLTYVRPSVFFTISIAAQMVLMAIIGGRGTVAGPVIGAVFLVAVNEMSVARFGSSELNIVVTGAILLVVLIFFPLGIVGSLRQRGKLPGFLDWD
ncbi:MAG TPA: branched-chain amino acid ABC transporter permease [Acidimicrobiia bacterium]|nr:branched-chain amino acid ABC transporter permease [Acidimicrobiia bacterium]